MPQNQGKMPPATRRSSGTPAGIGGLAPRGCHFGDLDLDAQLDLAQHAVESVLPGAIFEDRGLKRAAG